MEKCWASNPNLRPTFQQIATDIESVIESRQTPDATFDLPLTSADGSSSEHQDIHNYYMSLTPMMTDINPQTDASIYEVQTPDEIEMVASEPDNVIYSNDSVVSKYRR